MKQRVLTTGQQETLRVLQENFGLSETELERVLFLNDRVKEEPWIPADIQEAIARQVGTFRHISVTHDKYVREREQVIYTATVIDNAERSYTRSGAALLGEAPHGEEIDAEILASSRALNAALNAAGFNPFKAGSVVPLEDLKKRSTDKPLDSREKELHAIGDEAALRIKDLRQIHALAEEKGLIVDKDDSRYRQRLFEGFGVRSAVMLSAENRVAVISWLSNYQDYLADIPAELQNEAAIA